jgi:hypothetical protein
VVCGNLCAEGCFPFSASACGGGGNSQWGCGADGCGLPAYGGGACGPMGCDGVHGNLPPTTAPGPDAKPMSAVYGQQPAYLYTAGYQPAMYPAYGYPQVPGYGPGMAPAAPAPQAAPANVPSYWK